MRSILTKMKLDNPLPKNILILSCDISAIRQVESDKENVH